MRPVLWVFLVWIAIGCALKGSAERAADHVIVISIDGFARFHLDDPQLRIPTIRAMAAEGVSADRSETVFPSVTHPSHTTIVTGCMPNRHGVVGNTVLNRETGERYHVTNRPKAEVVMVPTLLDVAKDQGLTTASFFWPETYRDASSDYNLPEVFLRETREMISAATPPGLPDELRENGIPIDIYTDHPSLFAKPYRDEILTRAAAYVFTTYRPNVLLLHILTTDSYQHEYGPNGYGGRFAFEVADHCVQIMRKAVAESGLGERTAFVICADHGFLEVTREIYPLTFFKRHGILDKIQVHGGGFYRMINLSPGIDNAVVERALWDIGAMDGMSTVIRAKDFHKYGLPTPDQSPLMGDIILVPEPDTQISDKPGEPLMRMREFPAGSHGYPPDHPDMGCTLIFHGAGVRPSATLGKVHNRDIAPTVASLLGLNMGGVDGHVLEGILAR